MTDIKHKKEIEDIKEIEDSKGKEIIGETEDSKGDAMTPNYEFIQTFFHGMTEEPYQSIEEERTYYFRFLDLLCMVAVYQNDEVPLEAVNRIGALLPDVDLIRALEPWKRENFPKQEEIRGIFRLLLKKGRQEKENGYIAHMPISHLLWSGELAPIEMLAFLLAYSVSVNRKYERIYSILQSDEAGNGWPTAGLCHDLGRFFLTDKENDILILFSPDTFLNRVLLAPPRYLRKETALTAPLFLHSQTLSYIMGEYGALGKIARCGCYEDEKVSTYVCHEETEKELTEVYSTMRSANMNGVVALCGEPGCGRRFLLRVLAHKAGQIVLSVDFKRYAALPEELRDEILTGLAVKAVLEDTILYIYGITCREGERELLLQFLSYLQDMVRILFLGCDKPVPDEVTESIRGMVYSIIIPETNARAEQILWQEAAGAYGAYYDSTISLSELTSKYRMNPGRIFRTVQNTTAGSDVTMEGFLIEKDALEEQIRRICAVQFGDSAKKLKSPFGWEDLQVSPESKRLLQMACDRVLYRSRVNEEYGFEKKLPYGRGIAIVFYGPPGTGKTMAAGVIANTLGLDLYRIDLSQISSKYIGETEKNLGAVFDAARNSNAILFFDEADSLFSKRTEVSSSNDKHANAETAYLLQKVEEYPGVSILATNNMQNFDAAFKRRMTYLIPIEMPDEKTRRQLWEEAFPKELPVSRDVDYEILARALELSGSNIKSMALAAAYLAAAEHREVTMNDIADAAELECMKIGKLGAKNDILQAMLQG